MSLLIALIFILFLAPDFAFAEKISVFASEGESFGVETKGKNIYLFDPQKNKILFAKNADAPAPLASLTKLMTVLIIYEQNPKWDEWIKIEKDDLKGGGIPYLMAGDEIKREDAWNLMLVASSNDAAAALVRSLGFSAEGGSPPKADAPREHASGGKFESFTALMNEKARRLGFKTAVFKEPTGLDAGNQASAREVAALARVIFSVPKARQSLTKSFYVFSPRGKKARKAYATNTLLSSFLNKNPYYIISGKTGYLEESQYNLVFAAGKREQLATGEVSAAGTGGRQLVGVLLGDASSEDRFQDMKSLIWWGFEKIKN